ncbi:MAG: PepSY domain-containing protein [Gammaproteobacteria bacterium]|nr:PepSY domain-containing protein [Gammaproteobacteria bacterium]|tara:strand:+ start:1549 stop:2262 length:714 start_codon:yes stop_codon:yes gene_type:complete
MKLKYIKFLHRWLGLFASIQLLLWTLSGLFFTIPDIKDVRGDQYRVWETTNEAQRLDHENLFAMSTLLKNLDINKEQDYTILLKRRADTWVYQVKSSNQISNYDAISGERLFFITPDEASLIVTRETNLLPKKVELINDRESGSEYRGRDLPLYRVFVEKPQKGMVYVDPNTGEIAAIRTRLWRTFDFLWSLHIMDYKERDDFSHWLIRIFAFIGLMTIVSGMLLWYYTSRFNLEKR